MTDLFSILLFLDFTESDLFKSISIGIGQVAAFSLALSYPTLPSFPHVVADGFKNLVAICLETNYSFKQAEALKKRVENPDTYVVPVTTAQSTTTTTTKATTTATTTTKAEVKVEEKQEEIEIEDDLGEGLMDFF